MPETKFLNGLRCTGDFASEGNITATGDVTAGDDITAGGGVSAGEGFTGGLMNALHISKAADYALAAADRQSLYIGLTATEASKTFTLGLAAGQVAIVKNEGATNAFTLKNVADDTGTSLAAGKIALVLGSATANASGVDLLN